MSQPTQTSSTGETSTELKRVMGPGLLLLFIVGDILGTGVYALTGKVANQVGGAVWLPFLCAFLVAMLTACSYLELVTKYPQAAGAALYTHKAFGVHFLTFMVTFTVMCSGLTSASSAAKSFAGNFAQLLAEAGLDIDVKGSTVMITSLAFIVLVALINFRGVGESVKLNVVLTVIELSGLLLIIAIGLLALAQGKGQTDRLLQFNAAEGESPFMAVSAATALAFFALVGFEDSVNMAEETKNPAKVFPKIMLIGLSITGVIYILVAISSVALVSPAELGEGDAPLLKVIEAGAPAFPVGIFAVITMFAVANSALINMLMASRLLYGMGRQGVLPAKLALVHRGRRSPWVAIVVTTAFAVGLIAFADLTALGGTTSLLLLAVFTLVNIAVLVLRKDKVAHKHFKTPTPLAVLGAILSFYLVTPFSGRATDDYAVAGVLLVVGLVLWALTALWRRLYHNSFTVEEQQEEDINL